MYAIVNIAGVQVKASPDDILDVPLLEGEEGAAIEFDEILLVNDGTQVRVGQPHVPGATLKAEIVKHLRGPKIIVGTFKKRKDFRKKNGHRQSYTRLRVTGITA